MITICIASASISMQRDAEFEIRCRLNDADFRRFYHFSASAEERCRNLHQHDADAICIVLHQICTRSRAGAVAAGRSRPKNEPLKLPQGYLRTLGHDHAKHQHGSVRLDRDLPFEGRVRQAICRGKVWVHVAYFPGTYAT